MHSEISPALRKRFSVGFAIFLFALVAFIHDAYKQSRVLATQAGVTDGLVMAQVFIVKLAFILILFSTIATVIRAILIKKGIIKGNIIR